MRPSVQHESDEGASFSLWFHHLEASFEPASEGISATNSFSMKEVWLQHLPDSWLIS